MASAPWDHPKYLLPTSVLTPRPNWLVLSKSKTFLVDRSHVPFSAVAKKKVPTKQNHLQNPERPLFSTTYKALFVCINLKKYYLKAKLCCILNRREPDWDILLRWGCTGLQTISSSSRQEHGGHAKEFWWETSSFGVRYKLLGWRESLGTEPLYRQSQGSAQHITAAVLTVEGCLF